MSKLSSKEVMITTVILGIVMLSFYIWGPSIAEKYLPSKPTALLRVPVIESEYPNPSDCVSTDDRDRIVMTPTRKYFLCEANSLGWREFKFH